MNKRLYVATYGCQMSERNSGDTIHISRCISVSWSLLMVDHWCLTADYFVEKRGTVPCVVTGYMAPSQIF